MSKIKIYELSLIRQGRRDLLNTLILIWFAAARPAEEQHNTEHSVS